VRGLRLFVRPIDAADQSAIDAFLTRHADGKPAPACGLIGKLLGDIVAVVALELRDETLRIDDIVVARELRRKWIGKAMMHEVEQLAKKLDRRRVVVDDARGAQEFFRRVGFEHQGEQWIRDVR
jgi:ribosomal protein S18 acetylase RimI-like enzyme